MLDRVSNGLLLLSRSGQIVLANRTASKLLDRGDGLASSRSGRLSTGDIESSRRLKRAIERASDTVAARDDVAHALMSIARPSGRDPYLVEVSPFRDPNDEIGERFAGALVTVIDPDHEEEIQLSGLQTVYGLSAAELAVTAGVIRGLTYAELADHRGVSLDTIKTQVQSVFRKTGVNHRTGLVRRALRVSLPLDLR